MRTAGTTLIALVLLVAAGVALADTAVTDAPTDLLAKAMQTSRTQVELGKLAQKNAQSTGVNALAYRLQRDYSRLGKALEAIASNKGVVVPASTSSLVETFSSKSGAEFDAAYTSQMVTDQQKAVTLFTALSESGDPVLSQLARRALPMLREDQHLAGSFEKLDPSQKLDASGNVQAVAQRQ